MSGDSVGRAVYIIKYESYQTWVACVLECKPKYINRRVPGSEGFNFSAFNSIKFC